ncbi:MAG: glutamine--fructose-6-phosphate transaminase (isomerizing) [Candidatus Sericytochromatia bacterium]|nr:glutamine--fructose-6-phosphate transaminase (isomerizing) [Candidatus Tanganyikabacteria bacterium]
MCGIVGYVGSQQASEILINGLRRLEYRGYDSAGLAVINSGRLELRREVGKLQNLEDGLRHAPLEGQTGIGHTRWATHGRPTTFNAHPHTDCSGNLVVVHNGIIENYLALKQELIAGGHEFQSDTDTEILAHLVESLYQGDLFKAVQQACARLEGTYATVFMHRDEPQRVVGIRHGAPLVAGMGDQEYFLASDVSAILDYTRQVIYLDDGELVVISREGVRVYDGAGAPRAKEVHRIEWNPAAAEKAGYEHFMLKEIHEQPSSLTNTLGGRLDEREGRVYLGETGLSDEAIAGIDRIIVTACGTAYYAGLVGKYLIEDLARLPVEVDFASEFRYRHPIVNDKTLVIAISQSGETADTLAALRECKRQGAKSLGVINAIGSTMSREVDAVLSLQSGPEISVASTKAYTSMVAAMLLLAIHLGHARGALPADRVRDLIGELKHLPALVTRTLEMNAEVQALAEAFALSQHFLFLGRGINYPTAMEGALKLKEISYIHAEAYAAGEMKHGPIALINEAMPVLAIATRSATYDKVISNLQEAKSRKGAARGTVIAIATEGDTEILSHVDRVLYVPACPELLSPVVNVVPLQMLAYYIARILGKDIDQPRNLAKSVTVE